MKKVNLLILLVMLLSAVACKKSKTDQINPVPVDPIAKSNDEYVNAVALTINTSDKCDNAISGTTKEATKSATLTCSNQRVDDDVWFKFTATAAAHIIKLSDVEAIAGENTYRNVQVFQAVDNAPGVNILCEDMTMEEKFLTGLKIGTLYFIRISSWSENSRLSFKLCVSTPPAVPANDEYAGAVTLTVNSDGECKTVTSGTTSGATKSATATCSSQRVEDDVWFKFTATATAHRINISDVAAAHGTDIYRNIQVFRTVSNAPGENILCEGMNMDEKFLTGLTVGSTYFIRVSAWAENTRLNFKLCVSTPSGAPANDEYAAAVSLTVNSGIDCQSVTTGTTNGATKSVIATCSNQRVDDDVWFKFTATTSAHLLKISDVAAAHGTSTYRNIQVFEGVSNAPGTNILCSAMTMEEKFLTGLKVGTTYFVRVSSWAENSRINFKLCVSTPAAPPANDEPARAVSLTVNSDIECKSTTSGTTSGATQSLTTTCSNQRVEDDVWFKFTATTSAHLLKVSDVKAVYGTSTYRNIQVFESVNNSPETNVLCAAMTMDEKFLTGLRAGTTYFVRVSSWSENSRIEFKLCVSTPPAAPSNDEYTGAVSLTVNSGTDCKTVTAGTTNGATQSATVTCSNQRVEDDVWFKFTATATAHAIKISDVKAAHGTSTYRTIQVFPSVNNVPGSNILCKAMTAEQEQLTGLTIGTTYFVRVSSWSENSRINFNLCLQTSAN